MQIYLPSVEAQKAGLPRTFHIAGLWPCAAAVTCGVMSLVVAGIATTVAELPALAKNVGTRARAGPVAPGTSMTSRTELASLCARA